jgi:hypothetical protein
MLTASPAAAAARPLDTVKKAVLTRIDKRLDALKKNATALGEAEHLQDAHKQTLKQFVDAQSAGLTELRTKVSAETTVEAVRADARSMVVDYRVFMLTGPKVRLSIVIDNELVAAGKLHDRPNADDAKLDEVEESLDGKVATLLAIKPGPDGDAIRTQVTGVRTAAKEARTMLKAINKNTK